MKPFPTRSSIGHQRGIGLLQALLLVLLTGAAVVAGLTLLRAPQPAAHAALQEDALRWADEALVAYAAAHARLPCPVSSPTSPASACVGPGEKGWLPTRALEAVHPGGAGPTPPMRYVVFRGDPDSDLATASNTFSPHRWDRTSHELPEINGLDLCAKLGVAARATHATPRTDRARTLDPNGSVVNIAYGLVAPGPTPGLFGRFDGDNQDSDAAIAPPSLAASADYDDRTRARGFGELGQTLGCGFTDPASADGLALAAVDMMALAVDVSDEVKEQHESNKEDTQLAVVMASVSLVFAGINVALAGASIANAVSTLATASAQLSLATAGCPFTLVTCALIPPYKAAVIAANVAIKLATVATGLAAVALVPTVAALALTVEARDMAQQGLPSATVDLSMAIERTCIAAEGGWVTQAADANGNLTPLDPHQWRDGLWQEMEATEAELVALRVEAESLRRRIDELEDPRSPTGLFLSDYYEPYVSSLQAKLEAIRNAMAARFHYESTRQTIINIENELGGINESIRHLTPVVAACDASPPADPVGQQRCANNRSALRGLTTCDPDILTAQQVLGRQCEPWKQAELDDARLANTAAHNLYQTAMQTAVDLHVPPIRNYIPNTRWRHSESDCFLDERFCHPLIVYPESDPRETYAKLVYRSLGMNAAIAAKQSEFDEKSAAYVTARAQCDALRAMDVPGGASGILAPPVWAGANAILQAANCRGATGAVTPATCGATP